jgi:hypothetical protein
MSFEQSGKSLETWNPLPWCVATQVQCEGDPSMVPILIVATVGGTGVGVGVGVSLGVGVANGDPQSDQHCSHAV